MACAIRQGADIVGLATALLVGIALERERRYVLAQALQETAAFSAVFEENTARTFQGVDIALQAIASSLGSRRNPPRHDEETRAMMRAQLEHLPLVRALFVIGPDGFIQHDTDYPGTPDVSLADRDYFKQYVRDPALRHSVSTALQSRSGAGWFAASTRRISDPDGRFRGIVVAAVQLNSLSRLYHKLDLAPGQNVGLYHEDGRLMARYPADDTSIGRNDAQLPLFTEHIRRRPAGVYVTDGPPIGVERVLGYRVVEQQPLVIALSTNMDTVLDVWHRTATGAAAALAAGCRSSWCRYSGGMTEQLSATAARRSA